MKALCRSWLLFLCLVLLLAACHPGRHERMVARLQQLQAWNQADSLLTDDSLALSLADYFDRHGTANERMLAHYLLGRTWADRGEAPRALDAFHDAVDVADTTRADCDYYILCRVYAQMADLFHSQALYRNELGAIDMSMKYARLAEDTIMMLYAVGAPVFAYKTHHPDSALAACKNAIEQCRHYGFNEYAAGYVGVMFVSLIEQRRYHEAGECIKEYEQKSGLFDCEGNIQRGREIYYYSQNPQYFFS